MSLRKKRTRPIVAAWLAACLWTLAAAAQTSWEQAGAELRAAQFPAGQIEMLIARARSRDIPAERVAQWGKDMAQLRQAGVPAEIFGERIVQGLVKGVATARLDAGLVALRDNLLWANHVLGASVPKAEIRAKPAQVDQGLRNLEAALRADLTRAQVEQILGRQPLALDQLATLARVAANLRGWGAEPEAVMYALQRAGAAGMGAVEIERLENKFAAGVAAGRPPADLMREFTRAIGEARAAPSGRTDPRRDLQRDMQQDMRSPATPNAPEQNMGRGFPSGREWGR